MKTKEKRGADQKINPEAWRAEENSSDGKLRSVYYDMNAR